MDAMRERLNEIPFKQRRMMPLILGVAFKRSEFVREYLRYGHLTLPEPSTEGERIAAQQIDLLRKANVVGAKVIESFDADSIEKIEDEKEALAFVNGIYRPYLDDISDLAKQMSELAEQRYKTPKEQAGNEKEYREILYYTRLVHSQMFGDTIGLKRDSGVEMFGPIADLLKASREVTAAARGTMPARLAEAEKERMRQEAEAAQKEKERQDRIAAESRKRDQEIAAEKKRAEDKRKAEAAKLAVAGGDRAAEKPAAMPDTDATASSPFRNPGSRFDPRRFGSGRTRPGPPSGMGPQPGMGPRPDFGPRSRFGASPRSGPPPPATTPDGGVTITMENAGSLDTSRISKKFGKELGANASVRISNGDMTIRLGYKGSLDDVIKLIDFGKVASKDVEKRTIVLESK